MGVLEIKLYRRSLRSRHFPASPQQCVSAVRDKSQTTKLALLRLLFPQNLCKQIFCGSPENRESEIKETLLEVVGHIPAGIAVGLPAATGSYIVCVANSDIFVKNKSYIVNKLTVIFRLSAEVEV